MLKKIFITSGTGKGQTLLSAFDAALWKANIANYNLIKLSSIIPLGCEIVKNYPRNNQQDYGNKLFLVVAEKREDKIGKEAWAGIGWAQKSNGSGVFVEHTGEQKKEVVESIELSLNDILSYREGNFVKQGFEIVGKKCSGLPVCAIVGAVYQDQKW